MLTLGLAGAALIKRFEQLRLQAYLDQGSIPTIAWGHTGPDVHLGLTCTLAQADTWFLADTHSAVLALNRDLTVPVTQNQFDAMVSFLFNVGITAGGHSTLISLVNRGLLASAADEFPKWDHCAGVVDPGLTRRRQAEQTLFLSPQL